MGLKTIDGLRASCALEPTSGCWLWGKSLDNHGYGQVWHEHKAWSAHRLAYTLARGPIPDGLDLDHLCRVRSCINPAHLEAVSRRVNVTRGDSPRLARIRKLSRTHCRCGHEYTVANTMRTTDGYRACRACHRAQSKAAMQKLREATRFASLAEAMEVA